MKHLKGISMLLVMGALSFLGYRYPINFDVTYNKNNSLTEANVELLNKLNKPLMVELYTPERHISEQVQNIITQFQDQNKNIEFTIQHSSLSPEEKSELALRSSHNLILHYEGRKKAIDIQPLKWNQPAFANLIQQIIREKEQWIVFLSGHGEQDPFNNENRSLSILTTELKNKGFKVASLNLGETGVIPNNTQILVLADSRTALLPHEHSEILRYLEQGGNFLWLVNPNPNPDLNKIANILGIQWTQGTILDPKAHKMGTPHPAISIITFYPNHPITNKVESLTVFPWATPLTITKASSLGWRVSPLFTTNTATTLDKDPKQSNTFTIGAALTKGNQKIVAIGNGYFLSNGTIHNYGNLTLANHIFNWISEDADPFLKANARLAIDSAFTQTTWTQLALQYLFPYILSLLYLLIAWRIQRQRNNQRSLLIGQ